MQLKAALDIRNVTAWWVFLHRKHYFIANHGKSFDNSVDFSTIYRGILISGEMFGSTFLYLPSELMAGQPEGAARSEVHAIGYKETAYLELEDSWGVTIFAITFSKKAQKYNYIHVQRGK